VEIDNAQKGNTTGFFFQFSHTIIRHALMIATRKEIHPKVEQLPSHKNVNNNGKARVTSKRGRTGLCHWIQTWDSNVFRDNGVFSHDAGPCNNCDCKLIPDVLASSLSHILWGQFSQISAPLWSFVLNPSAILLGSIAFKYWPCHGVSSLVSSDWFHLMLYARGEKPTYVLGYGINGARFADLHPWLYLVSRATFTLCLMLDGTAVPTS